MLFTHHARPPRPLAPPPPRPLAGCSPTNDASQGRPPCAVGANGTLARRFVVAPATQRLSPLETIASYAADNGMVPGGRDSLWTTTTTAPFPTLREKLGSSQGGGPDFWQQVYAAPLLKMDAIAIGMSYANYTTQVSY